VSSPLELRLDGPESAEVTVVLAHGAGAAMDHPWMERAAAGLAARGLRVARFEFAYMRSRRDGKRRGPDRMPALQDAFRDAVTASGATRFALAGKSMGGRVATMLADELGACAVVVFGYPFHPPGKPEQLRTAHLENMKTPTLILQGERDPFGRREEVATYDLPQTVTVQWLPDGDHSLVPRKKSGHTAEQNMTAAIGAAAEFVLSAG